MKYFVIAACLIGTALARPDGAGGHGHHGDHGSHGGHADNVAPSSGYQEPQATYSSPGSGYEQPAAYAPSGYEEYDTSYEPAYQGGSGGGYGAVADEGGVDFNMILIPILIIAGLALLFPSVQTVAVDRKRRDAEDYSENSLLGRVQDIYSAVLESESCMERVACEVGGIVADAGVSKNVFQVAEGFAPRKYKKMIKNFTEGKNCEKIQCGAF